MRIPTILLSLLLACGPDDPEPPLHEASGGLLGEGPLNPFPHAGLVSEEGRLQLPEEGWPELPTPLPLDRLGWRSGFSPSQVSVVRLPSVDPGALPTFTDPTPGEGGVRLYDLTAGQALPVMAELDAWPDQGEPALLIRPLVAMPVGHRVAVAITTQAAARPARFDTLLSGDPPEGLQADQAHYQGLVGSLSALGLPASEIALAWDFPIGDGTAPLRSARSQITLDGGFDLELHRGVEGEREAAPFTWRAGRGHFVAQDFLVEDRLLNLQADGSVLPTGLVEAELYVHLPSSVADAAEGSVPVLIFGHGIFGWPARYLDSGDDASGVQRLADALGMIVVATTWRGLTLLDTGDTLNAATDFGQIPSVTDRLVQGLVNHLTLAELARSEAFAEHPALTGEAGQRLIDSDRLYYYGISLGGIEGMVLQAQEPGFEAAVAHVGGAMWSTMLERSSNWPIFEDLLASSVPDPVDRQRLYALSQLFWDPADPMSWAPELREQPMLLQVAVGDEQVPNFTSEALARSIDLPLLAPAVAAPFGVEVVGPQPAGSRAWVQLDPELPLPPPVNRPAPVTTAHTLPRMWPGTRAQIIEAFREGEEGQVIHPCGSAPCSASNPGD